MERREQLGIQFTALSGMMPSWESRVVTGNFTVDDEYASICQVGIYKAVLLQGELWGTGGTPRKSPLEAPENHTSRFSGEWSTVLGPGSRQSSE